MASGFIYAVNSFGFILVYGIRMCPTFILFYFILFFVWICSVFPTPFIEEMVFTPLYILPPLSKINGPYSDRFISRLSILFR